MGKTYDELPPEHAAWIAKQPLFFVATAPLSAEGHVNLSPKGLDTLRVLDERTVAYVDLTGSGAETVAHVLENGRITLMFCAFEGAPRIVRVYGRGEVLLRGTELWSELAPRLPEVPGARSIVVVHVERVADSCGYGVPRMQLVAERDTLVEWARAKGPEGTAAYRREKNAASVDGLALPDFDGGRVTAAPG
jgi:predicted pyridoxine 5'-phosphate oxidase superfamily flavin-nucleotide-binding protein